MPAMSLMPPGFLDLARCPLRPLDPPVLLPDGREFKTWDETIKMIGDVKKKNRDLEAKLLINRKIPGTRVGGELRKAIEIFNMGIFQTEICQRVVYVEALIYGVSVIQYAPQSKGAMEFSSFCKEVEIPK